MRYNLFLKTTAVLTISLFVYQSTAVALPKGSNQYLSIDSAETLNAIPAKRMSDAWQRFIDSVSHLDHITQAGIEQVVAFMQGSDPAFNAYTLALGEPQVAAAGDGFTIQFQRGFKPIPLMPLEGESRLGDADRVRVDGLEQMGDGVLLAETMGKIRAAIPQIEIQYTPALGDELSIQEYKLLVKLAAERSNTRKDADFLATLSRFGELLDRALLFTLVGDTRDDELWKRLDAFFAASLSVSQAVPRTKLHSKGSFSEVLSQRKIHNIFNGTHRELYTLLKALIVARTDMTDEEVEHMTSLGLNSRFTRDALIFGYTRLAEVASIVRDGFARPVRFETNFDPADAGLNTLPTIGVLFRAGPIQMRVLNEIASRNDRRGLLSQFFEIEDAESPESPSTMLIHSGFFYDQHGRLTLAEFSEPVRVDYAIFHPKEARLQTVRQIGVPTPFDPHLALLTSDKQRYSEVFEGSGIPFPVQTTWSLAQTRQSGPDHLIPEIERFLAAHVRGNRLTTIFIKPAKGSSGVGVEPFVLRDNSDSALNAEALAGAAEHIAALGDDAIVQTAIEKMDFRSVLRESIRLGHLRGTVDSVLRDIFGRDVDPHAELDWVIRNVISYENDETPIVLARRIIVNDQGVANTGQGGKMVDLGAYAPYLERSRGEAWDAVNTSAVSWAIKYARARNTDRVQPMDGRGALTVEISLVDDIITPAGEAVPIEVDFGFTSNAWRVDANRSQWVPYVLDRAVKRATDYRAALAGDGIQLSDDLPYDADAVTGLIRAHSADLHGFGAQTEIFEQMDATYDPDRDAAIIQARVQLARSRGEHVVVGIGGLGIAGIGPSILQAAAQEITDLRDIRRRVNRYYRSRFRDLPEAIQNAFWRLYALVQENEASMAQLNGALTALAEAQDMVGAKEGAAIRAKLSGSERRDAQNTLSRLLKSVDDFREKILKAMERAPQKNVYSVFAVQPLTRPPGHGYFLGLVNHGIFPHGISDGGLRAFMPEASPRLYATPSTEAVKHADTVIVTIRLDVEPAEPGKYEIAFGPLMAEVKNLATPLAEGIENARKEGREPPTVIIVTTQGPGTSRRLITAFEQALGEVGGREYKGGRDFYFVHAPSNIDPGPNWVNSLTRTAQPIGGVNRASIDAGLRFFRGYGREQRAYRGADSLAQVEFFKVYRNVTSGVHISNATMGAHGASLAGALFPDVRDHILEVAGMGKVRKLGKIPSHHVARSECGVGGPCLYKESALLQALASMGSEPFGHAQSHFTEFLLKAVDTSLATLLTASRQLNEFQPYYVAAMAFGALEKAGLSSQDAEILLAGIAYKRNMGGDTRHTPAYDVLMGLLADPLHLRDKPNNFEAAYPYFASQGMPRVTMLDGDVSYFREVDQRANKVPEISELADQDGSAIQKIPALAAQAKAFLIRYQPQLNNVHDIEDLRQLDPDVDNVLVEYIADFFFLRERGTELRDAWKRLAGSEIESDIWQAVEGKSLLIFAQGHTQFRVVVDDLPRLARMMQHSVIVDAVNFMSSDQIQEWQALGGIYFGVGKANPQIDFLKRAVEIQRERASRLLQAKADGDVETLGEILRSIQEELTLDVVSAFQGSARQGEIALRLHHGMQPEQIDWETWYHFGGGHYLLIGAEDGEVERTKRVFSSTEGDGLSQVSVADSVVASVAYATLKATSSDEALFGQVIGERALVPHQAPSVVFVGTEAAQQGLAWIHSGDLRYGTVAFAVEDAALQRALENQGFTVIDESAVLDEGQVSVDGVELELASFLDFKPVDYVISAMNPDPGRRKTSLTLEYVRHILNSVTIIPVLRDAPTLHDAVNDAQVYLNLNA